MNTPEEPTVLRDGYDYIWDESKLTWKVIKSTPPPEESTLREPEELVIYAKSWIKYISVATLQGENALTRKGVEDAIKGYSNVTKDFTNSLKSLIQARERLARIDEITNSYDLTDHKDKRLKDLSKQAVKVKAVTK